MGFIITAHSLIELLGAVQGIIFGVILILQHKKHRKESVFLGLFILSYALEMIPNVLTGTNLTERFPFLTTLPLDFAWLQFPFFFIYIQRISVFIIGRYSLAYLYPGMIYLILQVVLFIGPYNTAVFVYTNVWFHVLLVMGNLYSLLVGIMTVRWINRHVKEIENQFGSTDQKKLGWAKWFVIAGIGYVLIGMVVSMILLEENGVIEITASLVNVGLLYWISLRGIMQLNVKPAIDTPLGMARDQHRGADHPRIEKLRHLFDRVERYLKEGERFTEAELTIAEVAHAVGEHPRLVSQSINQLTSHNFNTYINNLRIHRAKELLTNSKYDNLSIEGIGTEVGFSSKSSFYGAFKRVTNTTPSSFKLNGQ